MSEAPLSSVPPQDKGDAESRESPSPSEPLSPLASLPGGRKGLLLAIYCFAQFLDTFNNSALFTSIPPISAALKITNANSVWLLSGYQLTFSAFMLTSGRLADVYNATYVFASGAALMGIFALVAGFVRNQIALIVMRALMGIGASLTVPSALHLIISMFPDPLTQSKAIAAFAGTSAIGNILGLFIGALLVEFTTWPWVFFFITITGIVAAALALICSPNVKHLKAPSPKGLPESITGKVKRLDPIGISILTIAIILFVFAVTSGSISGWGSAQVIANLVISIVLTAIFFVWEAYFQPEEIAALPPSMWHYKNFGVLLSTALLPFLWWGAVMLEFSWLWQEVYGWSSVKVAVHFLPIALMGIPMVILSDVLQKTFRLKWVLSAGLIVTIAGTVLLPFASASNRYWRFAFPGVLVGTAGVSITFTTANITIFKVTPSRIAGTVGAIFNCVLNFGCATGVAIITSIQTSVEENHGGPTSFNGRAAGFWFLFAFVCVLSALIVLFMKDTVPPVKKDAMEEFASKEAAFEAH
ncbi:MFS general substrate transporter [Marasmius fiardii PR-910]|nr:MFS general substrate transporter [Marasmius fiardii PR-910]